MLRSATLPFVLCLALPGAARPAEGGDEAKKAESTYRETAERANAIWLARPRLSRRDEASCTTAWQEGDRVQTMLRAATPPTAYAAYHTAVLDCIEAAQAVSDECLLRPRGGPKWAAYFAASISKCNALVRLVRTKRLPLPRRW